MKTYGKTIAVFAGVVMLFIQSPAYSGNIRATRHNLSISGPGDLAAATESRVCVFCHIPHREGSEKPYLWNRAAPAGPYTPYDSSTLSAQVGQPTGASRMCLSCHDGTIALGAVTVGPEISMKGGVRLMPENRRAHVGTDLSDDHPVSFVYDLSLAMENGELKAPSLLPDAVKLENGGLVQCTSCHDPHDDPFGKFLVADNTGSALCMACHEKNGWRASAHFLSDAVLDRSDGLWPNTDYSTVAANGCENCHPPHSAGKPDRLLYFAQEEENCLACHDGGIARTDVASAIEMPYSHPVRSYTGVHEPGEDFTSSTVPDHVECSDCHNAHSASMDASTDAALISGANKGTSGVSRGGVQLEEARFVYEICYKCHGDNNVSDTLPVTRQIAQLNTRLEFDPANPSFHPVADQGRNLNVPSLIPPYTTSSIIGCGDCHGAGEGVSDVAGPHGSQWPFLLKDRYATINFTPESPSNYALCYACHSRTALLNDESFVHSIHVQDQQTPCAVCHDPHGVSRMQGSAVRNSHLINFDVSVVLPDPSGRIAFTDTGIFQGTCLLNCHGKVHSPESYGP